MKRGGGAASPHTADCAAASAEIASSSHLPVRVDRWPAHPKNSHVWPCIWAYMRIVLTDYRKCIHLQWQTVKRPGLF